MHLVLLSLPLTVLFFQSILYPTGFSQAYQEFTDCSRPSLLTCGSFSFDVSYPFVMKGRPDYCGYPGFSLTCVNSNSTVVYIDDRPYQVQDIDYTNSVLTIVDVNFVSQSCPQYKNTTIDRNLYDYTDRDRNLTLYINCSSGDPISFIYDIGCVVGAVGRSYYRLDGKNSDMFGTCNSIALVPMLQTSADALKNGTMNFQSALTEGFEVRWTPGGSWCRACLNSGGACGYNGSSPADQTCYCSDEAKLGSCDSETTSSKKMIRITIGVFAGVFGFILACVGFYFWYRHKKNKCFGTLGRRRQNSMLFWTKKSKSTQAVEVFLEKYGSLTPKRYKHSDVKKITKSFSDKIGQGGYGAVFKGKLHDGRPVAVKVFSESKGNGEDFVNEVASIGRTYHVNIVTLLGFCAEGTKRALIYEFMPNGSLEKFIFPGQMKTPPIGWEKLYEIAIGIARGLEYLHRGCTTRIVHFDIKPHNILLDQDFCPKISDFGLAKLFHAKDSILSMAGARGTVGYIAPEVFSRNFGVVSSKSDVYSYGMMVLEMVGGRKNFVAGMENTSEVYFPHWVYEHLDRDGDLGVCGVTDDGTEEIARKMIMVGLWCTQTNPGSRPSTGKVVEMLEGRTSDLEMPPKPYLSSFRKRSLRSLIDSSTLLVSSTSLMS